MKPQRKTFYCDKCDKIFGTSTYFGSNEIRTWCVYCGNMSYEKTIAQRKSRCLVCKARLVGNQYKFCSKQCRYIFYRVIE